MDEFDIEADEEAWARSSAGSASYCPYCGYSVVDKTEAEEYECPQCDAVYRLVDKRWEDDVER